MNKINILFVSLVVISVIVLGGYQSNNYRYLAEYVINKIPGPLRPDVGLIDNAFDNVDVYKAVFLSNELNRVDVRLSEGDVKEFQREKKIFQEVGYQKDSEKKWRKVEVIIDGERYEAKLKLQGTSIRNGKKEIDSFGLKLSKKGEFYDGLRRFNLIYAREEAPLSVAVPNVMARQKKLIAPVGRYVNLFVNGVFDATFYMTDALSKEVLEKEYGITDYAIFKPNDDWDRMRPGHTSNMDLMVENMEIKGEYANGNHARSRIDHFFNKVKDEILFSDSSLVSSDYFARFLALHVLTSETHNAAGDNLRLLLNLRDGKIYPVFRNEGSSLGRLNSLIMNPNKTIEGFNKLWLHSSYSEKAAPALGIYRQFVANGLLRAQRDIYLKRFLDQGVYENTISEMWDKNELVLKSGDIPRRVAGYDFWAANEYYGKIKNLIESYLGYSKVFVMFDDKVGKLQVRAESFQPVLIGKIDYLDAEGSEKTLHLNELISAPDLDESMYPVLNEMVYELDEDVVSIERVHVRNMTTNLAVDQEDIYVSGYDSGYISDVNYVDVLEKSKVSFSVSNGVVYIEKGDYHLESDLLIESGVGLSIEAGTSLSLSGSLVLRGGLTINGTSMQPVSVDIEGENGGAFIVLGDGETEVIVNNAVFSGGMDTYIDGIHSSAGFMVDNAVVELSNVTVRGSTADDGLNVRNSVVDIKDSFFVENFSDQVDLDFCKGVLRRNVFSGKFNDNGDGLDLSGSNVQITHNRFQNFQDKALSVGEKTVACVYHNDFNDSVIGIASKDASVVYADKNQYHKVQEQYATYLKKKMYQKAGVIHEMEKVKCE